jgi:membrane-bound metal-dependent hydrolase YbcI (DUF457 family)
MANYKGHIIGGVGACAAYVGAMSLVENDWLQRTSGILGDWQMTAGLFIVAILFALWPDVDTNSKGQDIFYGLGLIALITLIMTNRFEAAAYLGLLAMLPIVGKHRGWTHSFPAMVLVPLPIVLVPYLQSSTLVDTAVIFYGAAVAGYFSHLLLDGRVIKQFRVKGSRYS